MEMTSLRRFALVGLLAGCGEVIRTAPDASVGTDSQPPDAASIDAPVVPVCGPDKAMCAGAACGQTTCLQPAHVPAGFGVYAAPSLGSVVVSAAATFDTSTGAITGLRAANGSPGAYQVVSGIGFIRRAQGSSVPLAVWVFGDLTIMATATVRGDASAMLASQSSLTLASTAVIDAGAKGLVPGPGGFAGGTFRTKGNGCGGGGAPSGTGSNGDEGQTDGGGGGGAFGTGGAAGGDAVGGPGAAGSAAGCGSALDTFLVGGSGGGGADTSGSVPGPFGGGGGGALQLTAMGQLRIDGVINLGGGGGRTAEGNDRDGAGGGSGGALFLEAPTIVLGPSAGVFANGGGGGSASPGGNACAGPLAEDGKPSLVPAAGSSCAGGNGGAGAAGSTAATAGVSAPTVGGGGGGGGGLGRIVLRTLVTQTPSIASTRLSPAPGSSAFQIVKTLN
jgi:hypothetical protein